MLLKETWYITNCAKNPLLSWALGKADVLWNIQLW